MEQTMEQHIEPGLLAALMRLAQLQNEALDRVAAQEAVQQAWDAGINEPRSLLGAFLQRLGLRPARWSTAPDESRVPALVYRGATEGQWQWGILRGRTARGEWLTEWWDGGKTGWVEAADAQPAYDGVASIRLGRVYSASGSEVFRLVRDEILTHRRILIDILLGGLVINLLALVTSFYSMQVYDRVIPAASNQTLLVLTAGVVAALLFDGASRRLRSQLQDRLVDQVDQRLARTVYARFLSVRLDQLPQSVGALSAQMRGYETVRGFLTAASANLLVDAPFSLLFVVIIALIGGWIALIPLFFLAVCIAAGLYYRARVDAHSSAANAAGNRKTGLLVEAIEGAETIKSGHGGWRMLSKWMRTTDEAREHELQMRQISEHSQHLTWGLQQLSYVLIIAAGALMVGAAEMTLGGLIACSILSGRVLGPVATIPGQLVQWAHAKSALQMLDRLWALQHDHHGIDHPVVPDRIHGAYRFDAVVSGYGGNKALAINGLSIRAGEKIGILGPVGAGKTTLLRLLSGLYKPQEGRVLLDDIDLCHIAKPVLAEHMAYVQQEGRLFSGTLRENLILGMIDPGDDRILEAARTTGLLQSVILPHPRGLQREIFEGGAGLSGGQRQLVNLTRAFLRNPAIWLLDEPTASMDRALELQVTAALRAAMSPDRTLLLVTHKPEMLELVDRLIVVANQQVILDGPKAQVLQRLQAPAVAAGKDRQTT